MFVAGPKDAGRAPQVLAPMRGPISDQRLPAVSHRGTRSGNRASRLTEERLPMSTSATVPHPRQTRNTTRAPLPRGHHKMRRRLLESQ